MGKAFIFSYFIKCICPTKVQTNFVAVTMTFSTFKEAGFICSHFAIRKREEKKKGTDTACDVTALIWGHSDQVTELLSKWRQNRRILRTRFFERWRNSFVHLFTKKVINLYTFSLTAKIKLKHTLPKKRERYKYQIYAISLPWQKCFQINQKKNFY